uniref:Uncharacterized protein n=1 Tax=Panagrolaimus sp. JU765 TaxID=591449 RepID=A0AC34PZY7_9BILA
MNEADTSIEINDEEDERQVFLPYEEELILSTMNDDVLIVLARGLGLERLCLNCLHMYCDPKLLVLVINASPGDEHYFLTNLKRLNPKCPPKLINSDVLTKQREAVYMEGGVQFITSRVLMVDLLTDRVPVKNITGIVVLRAHELLNSYQESFILRLYREKKNDGFVKAFTDNPTAITGSGIGQLQRLFDKLYVKIVRLLPRFDVLVKESYDKAPPEVCFMEVELPPQLRRIRMAMMDIIRTCVRELKSTVSSLEIELEDDALSPSAALYPSKLELDLRKKTLLLTERQERILNDLGILRSLLRKIEDLDPYTAHNFVKKLRSDREYVESNSGWLFTTTASKVTTGLEELCKFKTKEDGFPMVATPPKWHTLKAALNEISQTELNDDDKVLLIAPTEDCCRQLVDVIKFGIDKFQFMLTKVFLRDSEATQTPGMDPASKSFWNPDCIVLYNAQMDFKTERKNLVAKIQNEQKKTRNEAKKRKMNISSTDTPTNIKKSNKKKKKRLV